MTDSPKPKRAAKTVEQKVAELKRREAWKLTRKADKLEAQANALRVEAANLEYEARESE